jgi:cytochrome c2
MNPRIVPILSAGISLLACPAAFAADSAAGKALFRERCSVCHTAESGDNGGAQGPALIGVLGRAAASTPQFSCTQALRESKLTWDAASMNRFLAAPSAVVPGTSMVLAVPDGSLLMSEDGGNVIFRIWYAP